MKVLTLLLGFALLAFGALAQNTNVKEFGDKKVYYSAFNSSFLTPEVASVYKITRGENKGIVNIAVVPEGASQGATALVGGTVNNLIAQQQTLEFDEIREGDAVYYLAPFTFDHEDPLNFTIHVRPAGQQETHTFRFQRTLHRD